MKNAIHGWIPDSSPKLLVRFSPLMIAGKRYYPDFGNKHSLLLLKRQTPKKVSFQRAYTGWKFSSTNEEKELGEGRAFLRWLQKHELSIDWQEDDFEIHHIFCGKDAPSHDLDDELAEDHSFAIRPVEVKGRRVKLYVQDEDMLGLLNLSYGHEEDFLDLVSLYVAQRFDWAKWKAPSPSFFNWIVARGSKPTFTKGQVGLKVPAAQESLANF